MSGAGPKVIVYIRYLKKFHSVHDDRREVTPDERILQAQTEGIQ